MLLPKSIFRSIFFFYQSIGYSTLKVNCNEKIPHIVYWHQYELVLFPLYEPHAHYMLFSGPKVYTLHFMSMPLC